MTVPTGQRNWKCPECGNDIMLSVTQLDPIACDACLARMRNAGKTTGVDAVTDAVAGPFGVWKALPETTKLGVVVIGLLLGIAIGYFIGASTAKLSATASSSSSRSHDVSRSKSQGATDDDHSEVAIPQKEEERPPKPGPGYKWVKGRTRKDGTRGDGHWAKDPHYKGETDAP